MKNERTVIMSNLPSRPLVTCFVGSACTLTLMFALGCSGGGGGGNSSTPSGPTYSGPTYYANCSLATDGNGSQSSPWNSLSDVNTHTFVAGDSLFLARGSTCSGSLQPQGSGTSGSPITIDAFGTGALPIINAGSASNAAAYLNNQQYWTISDLEIVGGVQYGLYITGNTPNQTLSGFTLTNLNVHEATGTSTQRYDSGEVYLDANGIGQTFNDVVINGVTAHDSKVSEGLFVNAGGGWVGVPSQPLGSNITVKNSTAYNVYGDGILILELTNGTLENNVVHNSGQCPSCGSTPSGLWEWWCHTCTIQNNESYANQTWGGDGGDFDIDSFNNDNLFQYNYGHDSSGYCVAVFATDNIADNNNIVRYNVCSNNEREASIAYQGDIFLSTWGGGYLSGIQIYNNTIYWNPASPAAMLNAANIALTGSPSFFENNIVYSTVPSMVSVPSGFVLDYNIYWTTSGSAEWTWNGHIYSNLPAYQAASAQESHSLVTDPMLNNPTSNATGMPTTAFTLQPGSPAIGAGTNVCAGVTSCTMGLQDFFGNPLPSGGAGYNIGAYQ